MKEADWLRSVVQKAFGLSEDLIRRDFSDPNCARPLAGRIPIPLVYDSSRQQVNLEDPMTGRQRDEYIGLVPLSPMKEPEPKREYKPFPPKALYTGHSGVAPMLEW